MVNIPKFFKNQELELSSEMLPLLPLRDIVVFPHMVAPLFVGRNKSVSALSSAMNKDKRIFLATQRNAGVDNPTEKDICDVGVIGSVLQLLRLPDGTVKALIEGKQRARIVRYATNPEFFEVQLALLPDEPGDTIEVEALMRAVIDDFTEYAGINKSISKELLAKVSAITDPSKLADSVASHFSFNRPEGACPACRGMGAIEVKMRYLPSTWIRCSRSGHRSLTSRNFAI